MFFIISKLAWFFADPFSVVLLLGVLGLALSFGRFARFGHPLCIAAVALLVIVSLSPLGPALLRPLEDRFPVPPANLSSPAGIIVLGGSLDADRTVARHQPIFADGPYRMAAGLVLARRFPQARLIFTGGSADLLPNSVSEAPEVRNLWLSLGMPADRMTFEGKSRNTWENAIDTRALIKPKPDETWILVTSAWHMPRAMGVFRRAGFKVIAYPVDYRTFGDSRDFDLAHAGIDRIKTLEFGVHEWIGLVAYHLAGKTDAWFPGP